MSEIWLVGAGPGDPDWLTRKAAQLIERADLLVYDALVSPEILALAAKNATLLAVGRRSGDDPRWPARAAWLLPDGRLAPQIVQSARSGHTVVRLKGGDPGVFGRLQEELLAITEAGLTPKIVPGISAASAAAATLGIPLTERGQASSVTFATAHLATEREPDSWPTQGTLVLYMGLGRLPALVTALRRRGWSASTPAAVVSRASTKSERVVVGTLATLADDVARAQLATPAVLMVGEVVRHAGQAALETLACAAE